MTLDITNAYAWLGWLNERSIISEALAEALLPEVEQRDAAIRADERERLIDQLLTLSAHADAKAALKRRAAAIRGTP